MEIAATFIGTIRRYGMLEKKDRILLAVSGGPDSVAMVHLFMRLKDAYSLTVALAHFNHLLRGEESDKDAEFVKRLASRLELDYFYGEASVKEFARKNNLSEEVAARKLRYDFLIEVARKAKAKAATAHTLDDQAETVLLRMIRGTGLRGLCGVYPVISFRGVTFVRPLVEVEKKDILDFMEREEFLYRRDSSNLSMKYLRNRVRAELVPTLEGFNPSIKKTLAILADNARIETSHIDKKVDFHYRKIAATSPDGFCLSVARLKKIPRNLLPHIFQKAAEEIGFGHFRLDKRHIELLTAMVFQKKTHAKLQLAKNIFAERKDSTLAFRIPLLEDPFFIPSTLLKVNATSNIRELNAKIVLSRHAVASRASYQKYIAQSKASSAVKYLDFDRIKLPLMVRSRLPGDKMILLGMQGERNLKRLFIDLKIPKNARQTVPLLVDASGPIAVLGYRIAERVKITPRTKNVLKVECVIKKPSKKSMRDDIACDRAS
jgi:tRNA(Ile)-lysidine synthase